MYTFAPTVLALWFSGLLRRFVKFAKEIAAGERRMCTGIVHIRGHRGEPYGGKLPAGQSDFLGGAPGGGSPRLKVPGASTYTFVSGGSRPPQTNVYVEAPGTFSPGEPFSDRRASVEVPVEVGGSLSDRDVA